MVGVCPDGYVAFVFGPYSAKDNDATILNDIFSDERCGGRGFPDETPTLQEGDIFLADRGFSDSASTMERRGISLHVPSGIQEGKCREIVESTFGRLKKKFHFLALPAHNGSKVANDFGIAQIGFALLNMFHEETISDLDLEVGDAE